MAGMKGVYYEGFGTAKDVLTVGEMVEPVPGAGEVLVRVHASGVNPSDVKLRKGVRPGAEMDFPRVVPHSDGAGVIEAVGKGVDSVRKGERVWLWNAQWERAFGTASEYVALPSEQAVRLPDNVPFTDGACLGIPAMTAWYALYGTGDDLSGKTVLVTGGAGAVGRYACQMAALGGARVITTVSSPEKGKHSGAKEWIDYERDDVIETVMEKTDGAGVDLVVEVDFSANQEDSLALLKPGCTIAAYASGSHPMPDLMFYPLMFRDITLRMLICYRIEPDTRRRGEAQLTKWLEDGALSHAAVEVGGLDSVVTAHRMVETGDKLGTVVLTV